MRAEFKFELDEHVTTEKEIAYAITVRKAPRIFNISARIQEGGGNKYKLLTVPEGDFAVEFTESNIVSVRNIRKRLIKEITELLIYYTELEYK